MPAKPAANIAFSSGAVSFIVDLECSGCGEKYSHDEIRYFLSCLSISIIGTL